MGVPWTKHFPMGQRSKKEFVSVSLQVPKANHKRLKSWLAAKQRAALDAGEVPPSLNRAMNEVIAGLVAK
jgi:hypothetical protein